ncbi:hypothetical protein ABL78_0884 [Leptomonas seymouri]|uniref:Uncharacterized protein n=1 Tax=Leptomonas seymouri TaxID=5684 RepID=A0A0N1IMC8_LEPSE|nr:hypothetical protein ABL78_0884 [Leptomonas seymouri]|eukprot:KPI90024.1 hypothetical protein ABL78_0884 [Leptomonas seymouri]
MLRLPRRLGKSSTPPWSRFTPSLWRASPPATGVANNYVQTPFQMPQCVAALTCPACSFHTSPLTLQQQPPQQQEPGGSGGGGGASAKNSSSSPAPSPPPSSPQAELPSIEPVLTELRTIITRRYALGDVYRALSPISRKILIAHKLPLEELLLHLPDNFVLSRSKTRTGANLIAQVGARLVVSPPHLALPSTQALRLPPNTKPLPALVKLLGEERASAAIATVDPARSSSIGTGFVDPNSTLLERIQEVLTYIPNEWVEFTSLNISNDVKMRCMGFPSVRPCQFFLKHPKYFDVRFQTYNRHSFSVRRSLALQKQLQEAATRKK